MPGHTWSQSRRCCIDTAPLCEPCLPARPLLKVGLLLELAFPCSRRSRTEHYLPAVWTSLNEEFIFRSSATSCDASM